MANRKKPSVVSIHRNKAGGPRAQGVGFLPKDDNSKADISATDYKQCYMMKCLQRRVRSEHSKLAKTMSIDLNLVQ